MALFFSIFTPICPITKLFWRGGLTFADLYSEKFTNEMKWNCWKKVAKEMGKFSWEMKSATCLPLRFLPANKIPLTLSSMHTFPLISTFCGFWVLGSAIWDREVEKPFQWSSSSNHRDHHFRFICKTSFTFFTNTFHVLEPELENFRKIRSGRNLLQQNLDSKMLQTKRPVTRTVSSYNANGPFLNYITKLYTDFELAFEFWNYFCTK